MILLVIGRVWASHLAFGLSGVTMKKGVREKYIDSIVYVRIYKKYDGEGGGNRSWDSKIARYGLGTDKDEIVREILKLLDDCSICEKIAKAGNPYGYKRAGEGVVDIIFRIFG